MRFGQTIMPLKTMLIPLLLGAAISAAPPVFFSSAPTRTQASAATDEGEPDYEPIVERRLDFYDFSYQTTAGGTFNLRDYAQGKSLVIIEFLAGWCPSSNRNGHIVERLWTRYRERGLGVVGVAEYSDDVELRVHIGRIGIDYPMVVETRKRDQRKDSLHYKYRHAVGDKRKWGTPFYVIIDARDIEPVVPNGPLAHRVHTVSGELVEAEAEQFIRERAGGTKSK